MSRYLISFIGNYLLLTGVIIIYSSALTFSYFTDSSLNQVDNSLSILENKIDLLSKEADSLRRIKQGQNIYEYSGIAFVNKYRRHPEIPKGMGKVIFWKRQFECPNDVILLFNRQTSASWRITKGYESIPIYGDSTGCISIITKPGVYEFIPLEFAYTSYAKRRSGSLIRDVSNHIPSLFWRKEWIDSVNYSASMMLQSGVVEVIEDSCIYVRVLP